MQHTLEFKDWTPGRTVRALVEQSIARIERQLADLPPDAAFLRALVEKNAVRMLYRVSVTMTLPGRTLSAHEERHDAEEAVREAFAELEHQLARYIGRARRADDLQALYTFTRHEIAYHVAMRDLLPNEVAAADVVAAVMLRAQRHFVMGPRGET
jgi:ribosome-associated translation inhibitor RaiA